MECKLCGRPATDMHHMLHGSMRKLADKYGLIAPLCHECHMKLHDDGKFDSYLQKEAELMWLKQDYSRSIDDFIKVFGKNFLYD